MMLEKKSSFNSVFIPVVLLLLIIFAYIILKTGGFGYLNELFDFLNVNKESIESILIFLIVSAVTYLFIKLTSRLIRRYLERIGRTKRNINLVLTLYRYLVWVLVIFVTLSLLFKQLGSLITSLGLIGFGVTIALQKPILNFVGWMTIIFSKTYQVGDIISINNTNGRVHDIKVMYTNLAELNPEGDPTRKSISIPNEFVLTTAVTNSTKETSYVWDVLQVYITYQSDWKKAYKIFNKTVQNYYNKNIKPDVKKMFKDEAKEYEDIIVRVNMNEKGIVFKARYLVDYDVANLHKTELVKNVLNKLRVRGINLGKIEDIKLDYKTY